MTSRDLFIDSAKESVKIFFNSIAQGYKVPTSIGKCIKAFDSIWMSRINQVVFDQRIKSYNGSLIVERINQIWNERSDEVVGVNFPIEVSISKNVILNDRIDLLLINRKNKGKITYRAINFFDMNSNDNERYLHLRAGVFKMAMQSYLGQHTRRNYAYEVWPFNGEQIFIDPKNTDRIDLARLVLNISKAIRQEIWFPTSSEETCKQCPYKKNCTFSLIL